MDGEGKRLDPADWDRFRAAFHGLLDDCLDRMQSARDLPWQPVPADMAARVALTDVASGSPETAVFDRMVADIMPYATGNTHPRFFGWVHGTGLPVGVAAELVAATMNSNLGGRDHGAVEVERAVVRWLCRLAGLPEAGFGILTSGTSQATILALSAARVRRFGEDIRARGIGDFPSVRVYIAEGGHSCVAKALEVLGYGSGCLRTIAVSDLGQMDLTELARAVAQDRARGLVPLAVVGTAGSVNTGAFDLLDAMADYCTTEDIWLHVDAAFGFWTMLADPPWRGLTAGIGRADSVATDFHKWMAVPYDCGACLIRDRDLMRRSFSTRPEYLESQSAGLAGGDLWFCDYGTDLSRGFRALKVWATVQACGTAALGASITDNCRQAALMGEMAEASDLLDLAHPVISNLCCFHPRYGNANDIAARLQLNGEVVFSTTRIAGRNCLRAAIVNHRTTQADIRLAMAAVEREVAACR